MLYKDACNKKSNQKNLGTIKCSNLCTEIVEYTDEDEVAVCNLASISLPAFVIGKKDGTFEFDFRKLKLITKEVTKNLNRVIDVNYYPVPEAEYSNKRHRPIGMGVQVWFFEISFFGLWYSGWLFVLIDGSNERMIFPNT